MTLRLTKKENGRLKLLLRDCGYRGHCGLFTARHNRLKITATQIIEAKKMLATGMHYNTIGAKIGVGWWIISGVDKGRYDFILNQKI